MEEIEDLKQKLLSQEREFDNYKVECKQLEEFLEEESKKKEVEIRKLKQESISKDKNLKLLKAQVGQLEAECTTLKTNAPSQHALVESAKIQEQLNSCQKTIKARDHRITELQAQLQAKQIENGQLQAKLTSESSQIHKQSLIIDGLKEQILALQINKETISSLKTLHVQKKSNEAESGKKWEQTVIRQQKLIKDLKSKNAMLHEELSNQQSRSPILMKQEEEEQDGPSKIVSTSCVLLTKQHYLSPFLSHDKNTIKLLKSTKNGCYQKSLGCTKHRVTTVTYEHGSVLQQIAKRVTEENKPQTLIIYGANCTNKKEIMGDFIKLIKDHLYAKIEQGTNYSVLFIQKQCVGENTAPVIESADTKEQAIELIQKISNFGEKSKEKIKKTAKYNVRYCRVTIDDFVLEVATSSLTTFTFRDKSSQTEMLNHMLYSQLPNVLQSSASSKHLIITINPIVDLYQDCKNTLSVTFPKRVAAEKEETEWKGSPLREEMLNQLAKKRLQSFQRQNENSNLKTRRLESQCNYYKKKFDELECRLKNLLNTHQGQNAYLKKSPVTLSYEKMLSFVHSVQTRTVTRTTFDESTDQADAI